MTPLSRSVLPRPPRLQGLIVALTIIGAMLACNMSQPPAVSGDVLFQDDFSRSMSGWDRYHDEVYSADYAPGGYRIQIFAPQTDAWANPGLNLSDVRIEFDATKQAGPDDNTIGVLCRYQDARNFYFFLISSDGYAGIVMSLGGVRMLLSGDTMYPTGAVLIGNATNHIRADCIGFQLALYVNGILVAQTQSSQWGAGDVGLTAGSYDQPGVDVLFSNFTVIQP
jgi:hypothetical protein